jgi:mono/diheme cytochrome c family protein
VLKKALAVAVLCVVAVPLLTAEIGDGAWMTKVPNKDRERQNPFEGSADAVAAGAKLFHKNCASCHGQEGLGRDKRPNLHSDRVRAATPGELQWLLTNGSLKNGMPSWSRLPEQQRWQIITFLKDVTKN